MNNNMEHLYSTVNVKEKIPMRSLQIQSKNYAIKPANVLRMKTNLEDFTNSGDEDFLSVF